MDTLTELTSEIKLNALDEVKEMLEAHYGDTGRMYAHMTGVMSALLTPTQALELNDSVKRFIEQHKK